MDTPHACNAANITTSTSHGYHHATSTLYLSARSCSCSAAGPGSAALACDTADSCRPKKANAARRIVDLSKQQAVMSISRFLRVRWTYRRNDTLALWSGLCEVPIKALPRFIGRSPQLDKSKRTGSCEVERQTAWRRSEHALQLTTISTARAVLILKCSSLP